MGKSSAPATPDYAGQAIATANSGKYNEQTPFGSVTWGAAPGTDPSNPQPGSYSRTTTLNPTQQKLQDQGDYNQLVSGGIASRMLQYIPTGEEGSKNHVSAADLTDNYYRRGTQYMQQRQGDQSEALRTQLQNQGLTEGSTAYDRSIRNLRQTQDSAWADATDRALIANQEIPLKVAQVNDGLDNSSAARSNSAVNRLAQLLAFSKGQVPTSGNSAGGGQTDLATAGANSYKTQLGQVNAENAQNAQGWSTAAGLVAAAFSDRRLKSNIVAVSGGSGGLQAYEYDIFNRRERGYMADEVEALHPSAVATHSSGFKMVDYSQIGGRP